MSQKYQPNLFVPGFQKCGTATLHNILKRHPEIFIPIKKPQFFSKGNINIQDIRKYLRSYSDNKNYKWFADTSDSYIFNRRALHLIKDILGEDLTFLIIMRDPIKRIYSAYVHMRRPRLIGETRNFDKIISKDIFSLKKMLDFEYKSLKKAEVENELYLEQQKELWGNNYLWNFRYIYNSIYSIHIKRLREIFPSGNFKYLLLEDMMGDKKRINIANLYRFLEIDESIAYVQPMIWKNKNNYLTIDLNNKIVKDYWRVTNSIRNVFDNKIVNYILYKLDNNLLYMRLPVKMGKKIEDHLRYIFAQEIVDIENMTGLDLSIWKA